MDIAEIENQLKQEMAELETIKSVLYFKKQLRPDSVLKYNGSKLELFYPEGGFICSIHGSWLVGLLDNFFQDMIDAYSQKRNNSGVQRERSDGPGD